MMIDTHLISTILSFCGWAHLKDGALCIRDSSPDHLLNHVWVMVTSLRGGTISHMSQIKLEILLYFDLGQDPGDHYDLANVHNCHNRLNGLTAQGLALCL